MSNALGISHRAPGKMKSRTLPLTPHQQLLAVAEKIIEASAEPSIVKKYYRLKQKLVGNQSTAATAVSVEATPQKLSSTLKTAAKSRNTTTVKKNGQSPVDRNSCTRSRDFDKKARSKSTQLIRSKIERPREQLAAPAKTRSKSKSTVSFAVEMCEAICNDLNMLRDKILRKEYSRNKLKQIQPQAARLLREKNANFNAEIAAKLEAYEVAFGKATLALDVVSMQVKEDIAKGHNGKNGQPPQGERMKQDNVWLLDKVERLLNENYALRSRLIGSDVNAACQEVRNEIAPKPH